MWGMSSGGGRVILLKGGATGGGTPGFGPALNMWCRLSSWAAAATAAAAATEGLPRPEVACQFILGSIIQDAGVMSISGFAFAIDV